MYDATAQDPGLRGDRLLLTFGDVDANRQDLLVNELITLVNPSQQAYRPDAKSNPASLVQFALAPGARQLSASLGLHLDEVIQVDQGVASTSAVLPGTQEYTFGYRCPYQPGAYTITLPLPYGAATVRILAPLDGPVVAGPQLEPLGEVSVSGRPYGVWSARDIPAGGRLRVVLGGLPSRPLWRTALAALARPPGLVALVAALLALVVARALRRARTSPRRPRRRPHPTSAAAMEEAAVVAEPSRDGEAMV